MKYHYHNGRKAAKLRVRKGRTQKFCFKCSRWKDVENDFGRRSRNKMLVSSWCKKCCVIAQADRRQRVGRWKSPLVGRIQILLGHMLRAGTELRSADLHALYEKQRGRCYYTGVDMLLMSDLKIDPLLMSIDRVDSAKGYEAGNVVLACYGANVLKGRHSEARLFESLETLYKGALALGKVA